MQLKQRLRHIKENGGIHENVYNNMQNVKYCI